VSDGTTLQRISHSPLRGLVRDQLLERIIDGRLKPGLRLTEAEIASGLGTSRVPVREALQELARDGWIDLLPRHGATVHVPQLSDVEDAFAVRAALESECARIASQMVTEKHLARLDDIVSRGMKLAKQGDQVGASKANSEFHLEIAKITGNQLLLQILGTLESRVRWYFSQVAAVRGLQSWLEHQDIVEKIARGDAEAAATAARQHTECTLAAYHEQADAERPD
jgi:DNA-binding GntR family transcriptional regulator